jgi:choline dehydrogenase-like flavoprotein
MRYPLLPTVDDLSQVKRPFDAVVIGSGCGAGSFIDRFIESGKRILVLESGPSVLYSHFNNMLDNNMRRAFIDRYGETPWVGDMNGGILLRMLGGRTIASGAHLREFDPDDFRLWSNGIWPKDVIQLLPGLYSEVKRDRRVNTSVVCGAAQSHVAGLLERFRPTLPTVGVDLQPVSGFSVGRGYDSSGARLMTHVLRESLRVPSLDDRRLVVVTNAHVLRLLHTGSSVTHLLCVDPQRPNDPPREIHAGSFIVAASAIESARLLLNSRLESGRPATGRYLAEHIERRAKVRMAFAGTGEAISLVLPPPSSAREDRFQIHLRGSVVPGKAEYEIDIGGFAAMDPSESNRVSLSDELDPFGVPRAHTSLELSEADLARAEGLSARMSDVADAIGGRFITENFPYEHAQPRFTDESCRVQVMARGRSYHECGTLRMGTNPTDSVTDTSGRVHGLDNLFVADAALFPCVGIANPMLTISALSYHVANTLRSARFELTPT